MADPPGVEADRNAARRKRLVRSRGLVQVEEPVVDALDDEDRNVDVVEAAGDRAGLEPRLRILEVHPRVHLRHPAMQILGVVELGDARDLIGGAAGGADHGTGRLEPAGVEAVRVGEEHDVVWSERLVQVGCSRRRGDRAHRRVVGEGQRPGVKATVATPVLADPVVAETAAGEGVLPVVEPVDGVEHVLTLLGTDEVDLARRVAESPGGIPERDITVAGGKVGDRRLRTLVTEESVVQQQTWTRAAGVRDIDNGVEGHRPTTVVRQRGRDPEVDLGEGDRLGRACSVTRRRQGRHPESEGEGGAEDDRGLRWETRHPALFATDPASPPL